MPTYVVPPLLLSDDVVSGVGVGVDSGVAVGVGVVSGVDVVPGPGSAGGDVGVAVGVGVDSGVAVGDEFPAVCSPDSPDIPMTPAPFRLTAASTRMPTTQKVRTFPTVDPPLDYMFFVFLVSLTEFVYSTIYSLFQECFRVDILEWNRWKVSN
jgi:hypothetical protein